MHIKFMWVHKGEEKRCQCGFWFKHEPMPYQDYGQSQFICIVTLFMDLYDSIRLLIWFMKGKMDHNCKTDSTVLPLVLEAMGHYFSWVLNFGIHFHFPGERIRMLSLLYSHKRNGKIPNKCDVHENYKCKLKEPKVLLHYLLIFQSVSLVSESQQQHCHVGDLPTKHFETSCEQYAPPFCINQLHDLAHS